MRVGKWSKGPRCRSFAWWIENNPAAGWSATRLAGLTSVLRLCITNRRTEPDDIVALVEISTALRRGQILFDHSHMWRTLENMKRVVILGRGASGKSTLAVRLSGITGLPVIQLDKAFWRPGLIATSRSLGGRPREACRGGGMDHGG